MVYVCKDGKIEYLERMYKKRGKYYEKNFGWNSHP